MNEAISRSMGIEYNTENKGAYGATQQLVQLSERTIRTYIDTFIQYVNTYLIPKLMVMNYPQITNYPVLTYSQFNDEITTPVLQLIQQMLQMTMDATANRQVNADTTNTVDTTGKVSANSKVAQNERSNIALNAETTPNTSSKSTPQDGAAGGFDRELFNALVDALPYKLQEQSGYASDKRRKLLQEYRTSTLTGYSKKAT